MTANNRGGVPVQDAAPSTRSNRKVPRPADNHGGSAAMTNETPSAWASRIPRQDHPWRVRDPRAHHRTDLYAGMTARTPAWRAAVQAAIDAAPHPSDATLGRRAELLSAPGPARREHRSGAVRP